MRIRRTDTTVYIYGNGVTYIMDDFVWPTGKLYYDHDCVKHRRYIELIAETGVQSDYGVTLH
jgi:hypothetical protein